MAKIHAHRRAAVRRTVAMRLMIKELNDEECSLGAAHTLLVDIIVKVECPLRKACVWGSRDNWLNKFMLLGSDSKLHFEAPKNLPCWLQSVGS